MICSRCGIEVDILEGHEMDHRVEDSRAAMAAKGYAVVKHWRHQDIIYALRTVPYERALSSWAPARGRGNKVYADQKIVKALWAPDWAVELLKSRQCVALADRKILLAYAAEHDLGDAIRGWIAAGGDPIEYVREHREVHLDQDFAIDLNFVPDGTSYR